MGLLQVVENTQIVISTVITLDGDTGTITSPFFVGDGSGLTGLPIPANLSELTDDVGFVQTSSIVWGEVPTGTINSSNVMFSLANAPLGGGSLIVFKNGVFQKHTDDYTISSTTLTFEVGNVPQTGDNIVVMYQY